MHDINHSMCEKKIVWNEMVVACHCMRILGGK